MEQLQLMSNLDYLREHNRLDEYVSQYYFFLEQAIQQEDMDAVNTLLTKYLREVFYSDSRERLEQLLQQLEETIVQPQYAQYQPNFYLIKGNLHYFSLNYERGHDEFKKAISVATMQKDFHILGVALNNLLAASQQLEPAEKFEFSGMSSILLGMCSPVNVHRQYMLLILHIEIALSLEKYTYAANLITALRDKLRKSDLILREFVQIELLQLRIYKGSKQYELFWASLESLASGWAFQYDLQIVAYELAVEVARLSEEEELVATYKALIEKALAAANASNAQIQISRNTVQTDRLLPYMVPFAVLEKKAARHIARRQLEQYSLVMIHITQQTLTDEEMHTLKHLLHTAMLPAQLPVLFGCTVVSNEKMVYVLKQTEEVVQQFLNEVVHPIVTSYRAQNPKSFRVIISYVQNDWYGYKTFEQTLQHAYALVYYASYNGKGTLLNA